MKVSREISVGHIMQAAIMILGLIGFLVGLGMDRKRIVETQERVILWQEKQDERLYGLEVWRAEMGVEYPIPRRAP